MGLKIKITRTKKSRLSEVNFDDIPFGKVISDHMFVADYKNGKWTNPRIVPFKRFPMSPTNLTLHYGQAIFEGAKATRLKDGTPVLFRPEMHVERMNASATRMCMPNITSEVFIEGLKKLIEIDADWIPNGDNTSLYIRPFMFATGEYFGVQASDTYRFIIFTGPVAAYYTKPVSLIAETTYVRAPIGGTGEAKCAGNYAGSLEPVRQAREKGYDQILWLDGKEFKYIQEVGVMNLFFVINDRVVTPITDGAILKGITRNTFLHILKEKNIPCDVRLVTIDEIVAAHKAGTLQEAFGAGTAAVVSQISDITYKDYKMVLPAVETRKISQMLYHELSGIRSGEIEDTNGWIVPIAMEYEMA